MVSIHVINSENFYALYGIVTLIITILLLWYFVRSNIDVTNTSQYSSYYGDYEGLSDGVLRRTYDTVLPDGDTVGYTRLNLADVSTTNENDRKRQDEQIKAIHAWSVGKQYRDSPVRLPLRYDIVNRFSSGETNHQDLQISNLHALSMEQPVSGQCKLRGLVETDVTDVVDGENSNAHREGLNNPSGTPDNDFEELALPFTTTKYPVGNIQLTNKDEPKPYNMQVGLYGDVPVTFYEEEDMLYSPEWYHGVGSGLYIQNMRTAFKKVNWPIQKAFW